MAVRITLKRSSIPNKRPNADILDPGELALNTNALTPGLFFEADNDSVVKVGPTAVGMEPPVITPSLGETFYHEATRTLSVGTRGDSEEVNLVWRKICSPYLGGTNGYVVFVAPEFPSASDSVLNDGQSSPFATLNRAVIEITKQSIRVQNESDRAENNRYTIVVAPGISPVYNGPGLPLPSEVSDGELAFSVNLESDNPYATEVLNLQQFNPSTGGMLLPRGTSIIGMDLRKVELRPTYVPTYRNPTTGVGTNEPRSAVVKWTGNALVSDLTFRDKREEVSVVDIYTGLSGEGVFVSGRPHCFGLNDRVFFQFTPGADSSPTGVKSAAVPGGFYYTYPLGPQTFLLSFSKIQEGQANYIERVQLPVAPQGGSPIATCTWESYSHQRLSALYCASTEELNEFYTKVQLAFPKYFGGKANQAEVINPGETQIVAPVPASPIESLLSNSTANASAYVYNTTVRSSYGMCGVEHDGEVITGFRSVQSGSFTHISLQNDPAAYEIYTTIQDPGTGGLSTNWYPLQYATWATLPAASRPESASLVTRAQQLALLNSTNLTNIRWYYETLRSQDGKSFGIPDLQNDFRHFSLRSLNSAFIQAASNWSVGAAAGFWSYGGGRMTLNNCSSNFGSMAIRTEGFEGIGKVASPLPNDPNKGYVFAGIRMPLRLTASDTQSFRALELGPNAISVDNTSEDIQTITLGIGFQPVNILPFSLSPSTGVYVLWGSVEYRAFLVEDGEPPVIIRGDGTTQLRVRRIDSSFPVGSLSTNPTMQEWSSPFIKRWRDPRGLTESTYSLILSNTNPDHSAPAVGDILRLNQSSASASRLLRPGVQLDPGSNGGWGRVFQVSYSQASVAGDSPQFNEVLLNRQSASSHYVALGLCDTGRPWVQELDHSHGSYTTYANRNWYAAANDYWNGVYYSIDNVQPTTLKLNPLEYNSPWATSYCTERLDYVSETFQGLYAPDEVENLYPDGSLYFRGDQPAPVNYSFEFGYNLDNGSPSFGLLKYNLPSPDTTTTTTELAEDAITVEVTQVKDIIPNPFREFVVISLSGNNLPVEYCQVIGADETTNTLTLIRGLYGTKAEEPWPVDTLVTVQLPGSLVDPELYDVNWAPSKSAMIRFLRIMGYKTEDINQLLRPSFPSSRNVGAETIPLTPENGYAVSTGAWPLQLAAASQVDVSGHSMYSVGTIAYSRGLPQYGGEDLPTKQYYDLLCSRVWGGAGAVSSIDEDGSIPLAGVFTQIETGRPYGSVTSLITNTELTSQGASGGGSGEGVTSIFTSNGIGGGPIFSSGTLYLLPSKDDEIGGAKPGLGLSVSADGAFSLVPPENGEIGAVKAGRNVTIDPDGTLNAAGVSFVILDDFSGDFNGTSTTFTLRSGGDPVFVPGAANLIIAVGGVLQGSPTNFTATTTSITFTEAPPRGATFYGMAFVPG